MSATPSPLPKWFRPYTNWRFVGLPREFPGSLLQYPRPAYPHRITLPTYGWVLDEWDRFALWSRWLDSGRSGPRPAGLWLNREGKPVSPTWAVGTRRLVVSHRPTPPSPPPQFPVPPAHPMPDTSFGRNWVCMAQVPAKAASYPARFGIAFTADPAYEKPSPSQLEWHRNRHQRLAVWCDCHSTFPDEARAVAKNLGITTVIGEGESAAAFQVALEAELPMAWINISALTGAQKEKIAAGTIITPNELYLNQDVTRADRENWENLPVPGRLVACYDAAGEAPTGTRFPMSDYIRLGKWNKATDSFYDPGATDADRALVT